MARINIVLSTTRGPVSRFICWAQRCDYSHVEAHFDGYAIGARTKGVGKYTDFEQMIHCRSVYMDCTEDQYQRFKGFLIARIGEKYDWRAYLGFMLFKKAHSPKRWFCSELILEAFRYAGLSVVVNTPSYFCTPRDFLISPLLQGCRCEKHCADC